MNWQVEIAFKLDEMVRQNQLTPELKDTILGEFNSLFAEHYKLYGHSKENPIYFSARFALYMMARVLYSTPYWSNLSYQDLCTELHFKKELDQYDDPDHVPEKAIWESLEDRISGFLSEQEAPDDIIESCLKKIVPYIEKVLQEIDLANSAKDLFEGRTVTPRVLLINDIINCPDSDALKMVTLLPAPMKALALLLADHPDDHPGGRLYEINGNWLSHQFLSIGLTRSGDIKDIGSILPIIARTNRWEINDFNNLGIEITQSELNSLKKHVRATIYQHLYDRNTINHQNLMFGSLTEVIYKTIESVHVAIAVHEDNNFIGIKEASQKVGKRQYTDYLTQDTLLGSKTIIEFSDIIKSYLLHNFYTDGDLWTRFTEENYYYIDALNALDELSSVQDIVRPVRLMLRQAIGIDTRGYSLLFTNPLYKAWDIIMLLGDLFGTDALSFESLEDQLFDGDANTRLFQPNHMDKTKKDSLALYDQVLTNDDYHNTYHTMLEADQRVLKEGLRKLIYLGCKGSGSGPNGEITELDIRKVFRGKTFSVLSRLTGVQETDIPILRQGNTLGLWDDHFGSQSLTDKLNIFNEKFQDFRSEYSRSGDLKLAYMTLYDKYPIAKVAFMNKAELFNNKLGAAALLGRNIRGIYPLNNFMRLYEALLSDIVFAP